MVCFGKIIHNTVDIRLDILRATQVEVLITVNMQGVGYYEVVPKELMQCGMLVYPYNLADRYDCDAFVGKLYEKVLGYIHILGGKLR